MIRNEAKLGNINDKISPHFNKFKTEIKFTLAKNLKLHTAALKKIKKTSLKLIYWERYIHLQSLKNR